MEEVVNRNVFDVIAAAYAGATGFLYAWVTRNTMRANRMSVAVATMIEANKNQANDIRDLKVDIKAMKDNIDSMRAALIDWKETNNTVLIRVNKVLSQLED